MRRRRLEVECVFGRRGGGRVLIGCVYQYLPDLLAEGHLDGAIE